MSGQQSGKLPGRFRRWWLVSLFGRCPSTLQLHRYVRIPSDLRTHQCEALSYCHHHWEQCLDCDDVILAGFSIPEVR